MRWDVVRFVGSHVEGMRYFDSITIVEKGTNLESAMK